MRQLTDDGLQVTGMCFVAGMMRGTQTTTVVEKASVALPLANKWHKKYKTNTTTV